MMVVSYTPDPTEPYGTGRHPSRRNKRNCQSRRNISKHPLLYKRWPKCHIAGCNGLMYVDWYRMKHDPKDNPPVCRDGMCNHYRNTGNFVPFHRVNSIGCSRYDEYIIRRNSMPRSKHSPIPKEKWIPF